MLYYDLINEKDGVDYGEGKDMVRTTKNLSKQCQCCNFYYFITSNFKYHKHFCNGCFFCTIYEKDSQGVLILRIIKTTKGSFRTVSSWFLKKVEDSLEKTDLNEKYGWIYWTFSTLLSKGTFLDIVNCWKTH